MSTPRKKPTRATTKSTPPRRRGKNDIQILEDSFQLLAPKAHLLAEQFYQRLFENHPEVQPLFSQTSVPRQTGKLVAALQQVISTIRQPEKLTALLHELGRRHERYGARPEHYLAVTDTLLQTMSDFAGKHWTAPVRRAWTAALETIANTMQQFDSKEETMKPASRRAVDSAVTNAAVQQQMKSAVDNAINAIMIVDRELNITYANEASKAILRQHEHTLQALFPGFSVAALIGSSIDMFHKNPQHQRRLLSDPQNLPFSSDIQVGPLVFRINVTAQYDPKGHYVGNTLEWSDVTEVQLEQSRAARLQGTIDAAMTPIMMIDRDLVITYANASTEKLLSMHEATLRNLFPGFAVKNLIGTCIDVFHANPSHQRQLLDNPDNLPYSTDIEVGPLTFNINVTASKDSNGNYTGNALEWSDVTELRKKEEDVARLQSAVNGAQTNIMLCDEDLNITYANPAVVKMLRKREAELRKKWPALSVDNLIGQPLDPFHKNPAHQRSLLADPARMPHKAQIKVDDLEFEVNATIIMGPKGEYKGNMVEWRDITEQKDAESQIQKLIVGAVDGVLDQRIDTERYDGFMENLGQGINEMLDAVVQPLKNSIDIMKCVADGNLTQNLLGNYQGEFEVLQNAINNTLVNLTDIVTKIRETSVSIASASSEIADGNQNLSQRTEEQASSLEETASSMEELSSTVKQNADNSKEAAKLADNARQQAEEGGSVVNSAIGAMSEINSASKKISEIIGVIDEIAFQTNLLALNAAVEAARAGEQGRGFAVVASEVRNLAQRSAAAAKEIKSLINDSADKVEEGSRLVNESGSTLQEIIQSVKKVSDIIAEIAAASSEQSSGLDQVSKAVMQMDEVTQQNAALVEQAAAASESLDEQARGLDDLMTFFNVGEQTTRVARPASHTAPATKSVKPKAVRPSRKSVAAKSDEDWEEF